MPVTKADITRLTMPVTKADITMFSSSPSYGGSLGKNRRGRVEAEAGEERAGVWRADHSQGEARGDKGVAGAEA